ncbi:MAG: hypothetical protein ACE5JD_04915 [Candidatus Methylomirabilia bacterium]
MTRTVLGLFGLVVLGLVVWASDAWAQRARELVGINRLHISVQELDPLASEISLTKRDLERLTSAVLRGKIPDLRQEMASEYVLVTVRLTKADAAPGDRGRYAASVTLRVYRPVVTLYNLRVMMRKRGFALPTLLRNAVLGAVWQEQALLTAKQHEMAGLVKTTLERQLQKFAGDYHWANPAPPPPPEQQ